MEHFCSLMFLMNVHSFELQEEASKMDIVGCLPSEVGIQILRFVDGPTLAAAAAVSRNWRALCRADSELRRRVRRQLQRERRGGLGALQELRRNVVRAGPSRAFARLDVQRVHTLAERMPVVEGELMSRVAVRRRALPGVFFGSGDSMVSRAGIHSTPGIDRREGLFPHRLQREVHSAPPSKRLRLLVPTASATRGTRKIIRL